MGDLVIADTPLDLTGDITLGGVLVGAFFVLCVIVLLITWGAAIEERRLERAETERHRREELDARQRALVRVYRERSA